MSQIKITLIMERFLFFIIVFALVLKVNAQQTKTFTDPRDGITYKTVNIANQTWMAENLRYFPSVVGTSTGSETTQHYYVYGYNGTSVNEAKATANYNTYGVLYNWPAAMSACPTGWHLPDDEEWTQLTDYLGGVSVAGSKLKETGTSHWNRPNIGATNVSDFTALPSGYRSSNGYFDDIGDGGFWWSATEHMTDNAWYRYVFYIGSNVSRYNYSKGLGLSVRCVRD
jgi:uncharacterized protein (TIGR02145 family)